MFLVASGLPGGLADGLGAQLRKNLLSFGLPENVLQYALLAFRARFWVGIATLGVGLVGDHLIGARRIAEVVQDRKGFIEFLLVSIQLALIVWICRRFNLEHRAFSGPFLLLTSVGFVVHCLLPPSLRLKFFILLSLAAIVVVLGWRDGLALTAFSLLFITLARLPFRLPIRILLLLAAVAGVIYLRGAAESFPWSDAIWPIFWSMFLFRMVIFLFDRRIGKSPLGWKESLAYFFLLPNVVFPLFPPIDYATLWRTYYDTDPHRIHRTGIRWMLVGVLHLLVYRYIDRFWIESPDAIITSRGLIQYVVASYLLIIRLSGQFHLIVGILHLFGFHLPRVMDHYFLATGFTDYWRRVNIYWKDFIQKLIYYPAFFRLRSLSNTKKLITATLLGFLATWLFHSGQWFGLRGSWTISSTDIFFWSSLAVLVLGNSLYESRYGRKRSLVRRQASLGEITWHGLKATSVFAVMSILWSIWISPSLRYWWNLVSYSQLSVSDVLIAMLGIGTVLTIAVFVKDRWFGESESSEWLGRQELVTIVGLLGLGLLGLPHMSGFLGGGIGTALAEFRTPRLSRKHDAMQFQGYYEKLNDVNDFNYRLHEIYAGKSHGAEDHARVVQAATPRRSSEELIFKEKDSHTGTRLIPNLNTIAWGHPLRTNRWGMRDKDYGLLPPAGTIRMALLGNSCSLARGVAVEDGFEHLLESRLNLDSQYNRTHPIEILNFAVGKHGAIQRLSMLEHSVLSFKPQIVLFTYHLRDRVPDLRYLCETLFSECCYPEIREIARNVGVDESTPEKMRSLLLDQRMDDFRSFCFQRVVEICRRNGIRVFFLLLPTGPSREDPAEIQSAIAEAKLSEFDAVIDVTDAYDGFQQDELQISARDNHPSPKAHKLIFEKLYKELVSNGILKSYLTDSNTEATAASFP